MSKVGKGSARRATGAGAVPGAEPGAGAGGAAADAESGAGGTGSAGAPGTGSAANAGARRASTPFLLVSWAFVVLSLAEIFFMSSNTGTGLNEGLGLFSSIYRQMQAVQTVLLGSGVDVLSPIAHFCEYTLLGVLLANALHASGLARARAWAIAIVCASAYGVTDEIHQIFVADRTCDPADWLVDTIGATLGASITRLVLRTRGRNRTCG